MGAGREGICPPPPWPDEKRNKIPILALKMREKSPKFEIFFAFGDITRILALKI
jgi:hypothetical protein